MDRADEIVERALALAAEFVDDSAPWLGEVVDGDLPALVRAAKDLQEDVLATTTTIQQIVALMLVQHLASAFLELGSNPTGGTRGGATTRFGAFRPAHYQQISEN